MAVESLEQTEVRVYCQGSWKQSCLSFPYFLFSCCYCMWMHICVHACAYTVTWMSAHLYVYTHVCGDQKSMPWIYCVAFHFIVLKSNDLTDLDTHGFNKMAGQWTPAILCLHPPELGLKMCDQFLTWVLRHLNSGPHACVSRTVLTKLLPLQPFSTHCNSLQKSKPSKQILCLTLLLVIYTSSVKRLNKNLLELKSLFIVLCGFVDPIYL